MNYKDRIIWRVADDACKKVSGRVVRSLQSMTEGMQSGDDSPLRNIWDEVCVQVQIEASVMWDCYEDTIKGLIASELKLLEEETKQAIWLQTSAGDDWVDEIEGRIEYGEVKEYDTKAEYVDDDIVEYILGEYILHKAADWTNRRIEKHINEGYDLAG